jgi:hypothetical protein
MEPAAQPLSHTERPELAVVVPSVNGLGDLRGCLDALTREATGVRLEVLVPERCGDEVRHAVAREYPWVRVLAVGPEKTIPEMRALAFREAGGLVIAVIEDHVIVPPGWARRMLDEIRAGADVVGGSVTNAATGTTLDWAAFFCEYSHCLPPLSEGPAAWLTGNNVAYRGEVLARYRGLTDTGRWENVLHDRMKADGIELICRPDISVGHKKHYTFGEYFSQRYLYARSYAGLRVIGVPSARRTLFVLASLGLPPLLLWRIFSRVASKGQDVGLLLRCTPLIAVFVTAWAWGELVGYAAGPGDALQKVC